MVALLTLVKPPATSSERRSGSHHWSSVQQEELQLQALATLANVAPLMLDDYMSCQGNTCLLLLLDWCVRQGEQRRPRAPVPGLWGQRLNIHLHLLLLSYTN